MSTKLDDALLAFWRLTERFEGIPPTVREFQEEAGLSSTSVARHWRRELEEAGLVYTPAALRRENYSASRVLKLSPAGWTQARKLRKGAGKGAA